MGIFLRLKHWQVFLLTFGLFVLFLSVVVISVLDLYTLFGDSAFTDVPLRLLLLLQTISVIFSNFWMFAIGTRLHQKHYYNSFMLLLFRWFLYFSTLANAARFVVFPAIGF